MNKKTSYLASLIIFLGILFSWPVLHHTIFSTFPKTPYLTSQAWAETGGAGDTHLGDTITSETFDKLNPLKTEESEYADQLSTPGGIISRFLGSFAFPIAGLVLFVMLVWGGMEMMAGSATSKSVDAGKQRITSALLGFMLLFLSYWIGRILEIMFGIKFL